MTKYLSRGISQMVFIHSLRKCRLINDSTVAVICSRCGGLACFHFHACLLKDHHHHSNPSQSATASSASSTSLNDSIGRCHSAFRCQGLVKAVFGNVMKHLVNSSPFIARATEATEAEGASIAWEA